MLAQIFKSILLMSASGGVLSIFLLCLKPITRKIFSPRWQYYIWIAVLIVMILPVRFSVPSRIPDIPVAMVNQAENIEMKVLQTDTKTADMQVPEQAKKLSIPKPELPQNIFEYLAKIWLWGMIVILLTKITKYNLFLRAIHKNSVVDTDIRNVPKRLTVRKTDMLDAPLIVGLFKPTLFLSSNLISEKDMNYILMHELTHYKRCDILYKWFAMIVSSIHWFNPFVYIVLRQIDTECEVSCDFAVTSKLSENEKNNYMRMILDMLEHSKSNLRPLTTQIASSKKTIRRRFTMIRNKKATSKFVSAISVLTAVIMFTTTVFASGILSDLTTDDYTIEILSDGKKIELADKPFIENGEIYVPFRETLEKAMQKNDGIVDIKWDNGTIDVIVAYYQGDSGMYQFKIGGNYMKLQHINYEDYENNSVEKSMIVTALSLKKPPVLKDTITYVTLKDVNYILYGYTNRRDENNKLRELNYAVSDKNGKALLDSALYPIDDKKWDFSNGIYTESLNGVSSADGIIYSSKYFSAKSDKIYYLDICDIDTSIASGKLTFTVKNKNTGITVNDLNDEEMIYAYSTDGTGDFETPNFMAALEFQTDTDFYIEITTSNSQSTKFYGTYTISEAEKFYFNNILGH